MIIYFEREALVAINVDSLSSLQLPTASHMSSVDDIQLLWKGKSRENKTYDCDWV